MKKAKQLSFIKPSRKFFGGALIHKKRKSMRPLSSKDAIHFVLRSQWAVGPDSFLTSLNRKAIERIIRRFAMKFGIRIYQQALNSNHIHLVLRISNRLLYQKFIKSVSGKIASHVMGEQSFKTFSQARDKGINTGDGVRGFAKRAELDPQLSPTFWQFRPFSRVVNWGNDFKTCVKYVKQNVLEALGFVAYKKRKNYYTRWLDETLAEANINCS